MSLRSITRACAFLLTLTASLGAQDLPTGRIVGRVVDAVTGQGITDAGVQVVGTTIGVQSGVDGRFTLNKVNAGTVTIQVRRLGYTPKTITGLLLGAGQTLEQNVSLATAAARVEAQVVTASVERGTVNEALDKQRTAVGVVNAVTAEQIQRSPDSDASQAVQRVSGVTVQDDKTVAVRGLAERYTTVALNGARVPSPEPEKRVDHLVAYETGDDMFDMSEGFVGRLQYLIGYNSVQLTPRTGAGSLATDLEGIENDGCNGSGCDNGFNQAPFTVPVIANFTLIGCGAQSCTGPAGGFGMMLRRGTGGYYVNGVIARFPAGGVSLRDAESYARGGSIAIPDAATSDLLIRNVLFSDNGPMFQANTATSATQFSLDAAGNALTASTATSASLFAALPAAGTSPSGVSALDWTPAASAAIATGGLAAFTGKLATRAGTFVTATTYLGAAQPAGAKWWTGWTTYARN